MLTLLSVLFFIIVKLLLHPPKLPSILYFFSLLAFSIAVDGNYFGLWEDMYVYDRAVNTGLVYVYLAFFFLGYFVFCLAMYQSAGKNSLQLCIQFDNEHVVKLRRVARFIAIVSISAALINLSRAGDVSQLILSPRAWENLFGKYVLINYLYFSHLCAIPLFVCLFKVKSFAHNHTSISCRAGGVDYLLFLMCIMVSFLHGIKFTVLHAFVYAIFSFYIFSGFKFNKVVFSLGLSLFSFFCCLFFVFVRGGGWEGLIGYITSASVNSIYLINSTDFYEVGGVNAFFSFF